MLYQKDLILIFSSSFIHLFLALQLWSSPQPFLIKDKENPPYQVRCHGNDHNNMSQAFDGFSFIVSVFFFKKCTMEPSPKHVVGNTNLYYRVLNFWKASITSHLFSVSKARHSGKLVGAQPMFVELFISLYHRSWGEE